MKKHGRFILWTLIVAICAVAMMLAAGDAFRYGCQVKAVRTRAYDELEAIASLKIYQIINWQDEQRTDALLDSTVAIRVDVFQWFTAMRGAAMKAALRAHVEAFRQQGGCQDVIRAAPEGDRLLSCVSQEKKLDSALKEPIVRAVCLGESLFSDIIQGSRSNKVYLGVTAPILNKEHRTTKVRLLRSDPEKMFHLRIQSWPIPRASGETLLVRREGTDSVYLNELHHPSGPSLSVRTSLSKKEIPAIQAMLGNTGTFDGLDHHGVGKRN